MKLPDKFKPHLIASKDQTRYILTHVLYKHGMAIATNGRSLIAGITSKEWAEEDEPEEALIPVDALKVACKKRAKSSHSILNGAVAIREGEVEVRPNLESKTIFNFPNIEIHKFPNATAVLPHHENPIQLFLSAELLKELADALGDPGVCIQFDKDNMGNAMIVTAKGMTDRFGLLMPMRMTGSCGGDHDMVKSNLALKKLTALKNDTPL